MSRHYTPDDKTNALAHLAANGGNIVYTSHQLNIPERTLRHWRQQHLIETQNPLPLPPPPPRQRQSPLLDSDLSDSEVLAVLRQQIIAHIINTMPTLVDGLNLTSPYHRILALSQLLNHLERLDKFIPRATWREKHEPPPDLKSIMAAIDTDFEALMKSRSTPPKR